MINYVKTMQKREVSEMNFFRASSDDNLSEKSFSTGHLDKERVKRCLAQGKYVYELFSVMVHSGSAAGGHYFAYIK